MIEVCLVNMQCCRCSCSVLSARRGARVPMQDAPRTLSLDCVISCEGGAVRPLRSDVIIMGNLRDSDLPNLLLRILLKIVLYFGKMFCLVLLIEKSAFTEKQIVLT